jgi:hypothetical protein
MNQKARLGFVLMLSLLGAAGGYCTAADGNLPAGEIQKSDLISTVEKLSSFKNFRMKVADLDKLIKNNCTKKSEDKSDFNVESEYACDRKSGLENVRIDWRNGDGDSYVMALSVYFSYPEYEQVKKAMEKKLGRASLRQKDMVLWRSSSDKKLNELGNPAIYASRDPDDHTASFQLVLEQGP